ncbi:MAG: histidine phosphatase family protein [Rhodospirillales bacterium]
MFFPFRFAACLFAITVSLTLPAAASDDEVWQALKSGGHVAMMRHALAPGTGDPGIFRLNDCTTQRNLNDRGRRQAVAIGEAFEANGITEARVRTSQWCRCRETAELLGLGHPEDLPDLNSFFESRQNGPRQTAALRQWLGSQSLAEPLVLVTHQVNITALTGVFPSSGEIVVFRLLADGAVDVIGTILISQ